MVFLVHRNIGGTDHRNTGDTGDIFPIITGKSRFWSVFQYTLLRCYSVQIRGHRR